MQPLRIILPGKFYDTQIYSGKLYLWSDDNSIHVFDWDHLVNSLISRQPELRFALECGLKQSEYLYGSRWELFFQETDIRKFIFSAFEMASRKPLEISAELLRESEIKHQENPFPFPHADSLIYKDNMYVGSTKGIFRSTCSKRNVNPVSSRPIHISDVPCLSLSASYDSLSISAGQEGLIELHLKDGFPWWYNQDMTSFDKYHYYLSKLHSSSSQWAFYSIFSSSHVQGGYLVEFVREEKPNEENNTDSEPYPREPGEYYKNRIFSGIRTEENLFNNKSYSWGRQDKLCQITKNTLKVLQYIPWEKEVKFKNLGEIEIHFNNDIVSCDTALFGYIIETDKGIMVLDSRLESTWIPDEPVNWRVFPKSTYYENHLHVIYPDRLEIYSFNEDYFVNQNLKKVGITHWDTTRGQVFGASFRRRLYY
jgi:hypothetical protein